MILNKNINDYCNYTLPGINRIWLTTWDKPKTIYNIDNLDLVTTINNDYVWYSFDVEDTIVTFNEEMDISSPNGRYYRQTINLYFERLEWLKRRSVDQLVKVPLLAILEDKNGKYWIVGLDAPLRSTTMINKTGTKNDSNDYSITLTALSKLIAKELDSSFIGNSVTYESVVIDSPVEEFVFDAYDKIYLYQEDIKDVKINS